MNEGELESLFRDRMNIKMTNTKLCMTPTEIVNENKNIIMLLKSQNQLNLNIRGECCQGGRIRGRWRHLYGYS